MRLRQLIAAALFAGLGLIGTSAPGAEETPFQPVAIVNDVPITGFDLGQRAQILLALGFPRSDQEGLRQEALNQLIDERLKLQATRDMNIEITPEMIEGGIEAFAEQTGMSADAFRARLKAQGVSDQALNDMARAEIGWLQVIRARFSDRVTPDDADVEAELARMGGAGAEYHVLEIGLPFDAAGRSEAETRELAEELSRSLNSGSSFEQAVARYSASPSAERGGDVGWISTERMPPELRQALAGLEIGQVSRPLPVSGGVSILKLVDKRSGGGISDADREAVTSRMMNERGARLAEGLLQELRRDALITIR
ncbi:MAG TPA: peptidylprolyl isomerase [Paracoccaceae bacterium]|nr:peptidylprolyl isomerase [Paracoccaceae bacterium]